MGNSILPIQCSKWTTVRLSGLQRFGAEKSKTVSTIETWVRTGRVPLKTESRCLYILVRATNALPTKRGNESLVQICGSGRSAQNQIVEALGRLACPAGAPPVDFENCEARPAKALPFASRSVRRALLLPQASPGSPHRCGEERLRAACGATAGGKGAWTSA